MRDLQGNAIVVHYNPGKPSNTALLEPDIEALLQNRPPAPAADFPSAAKSVPDWIRPFIWVSVWLSTGRQSMFFERRGVPDCSHLWNS